MRLSSPPSSGRWRRREFSGGRLVCLDITQPPTGPFGALYRLYFNRLLPPLAGAISGDRAAYRYLPASLKGFQRYLRSHGGFEPCAAGLRQQFRFLGDTGAYYFLYVVGEAVPSYEDWCAWTSNATGD